MKPRSSAKKRMRNIEDHSCPAYRPFTRTGLVQGVRSRVDVDYARHLVGLSPNSGDQAHWSPNGWCERPKINPYVCAFLIIILHSVELTLQSYEFILSSNGGLVPEDLSPSFLKLGVLPEGYIIHNITGIRTQIVQRLDEKGFDIKKCKEFHHNLEPH